MSWGRGVSLIKTRSRIFVSRRRVVARRAIAVSLVLLTAGLLPSQSALGGGNCTRTSVGFTPLNDLRTGQYRGFTGGLYPGGSNTPPAAHATLGAELAPRVVPRDGAGAPSPTGQIVFLSIGMSNTRDEFRDFVLLAETDRNRHPSVRVFNGAAGNQTASRIRDPNAEYWTGLNQRLIRQGMTPAQVQVVWLKEANAGPEEPFPQDAQILQDDIRAVTALLRQHFPNLWVVYLSSRIYAGYATTGLNPEPWAYQGGFAVKWLIESQIRGQLPIGTYPWLAWGPYLWADGLRARSDGLSWLCSDFIDDGTHPSGAGIEKVSEMLLNFVHSEPTARVWYENGGSGTAPPPNQPPIARISANPTSGSAPMTATFDGGSSSDPEGGALTFAWDLDGDAAFDDSASSRAAFTYNTAGARTVRLRVQDPQGATGTASITIRVDPPAPAVPVTIRDTGYDPERATIAPGQTVRWTNGGTRSHTVTDGSGMALFDSGSLASTTTFSFTFFAAGRYLVRSTLDTRLTGSVWVPMTAAPAAGTLSSTYAITWATRTAPSGFAYDVQVQRPNSTAWTPWRQTETASGTSFRPDAGTGTYGFRARLRNTATASASAYSAPVTIQVSSP